LTNFLLLYESISNYSKTDIDQGNTPFDIYKLCSCIRETFCLSYSIRKENNFYIFCHNGNILIKFEGEKLRFLSSDERSQALLINKAINLSTNIKKFDDWYKSTPGIYVRKFQKFKSFVNFIKILRTNNILIMNNFNKFDFKFEEIEFNQIRDSLNSLFIIPIYKNVEILNYALNILKENEELNLLNLPKIESIENTILYINYKIDQIQNSKSNYV
jgi:tRNA pseudouridine-54 N-methylase